MSDIPPKPEPVRFPFPVEWGKCREFSLALLDADPAQAASTAGDAPPESLLMPATMPVCASRYSPDGLSPIGRMIEAGQVDRRRLLQGELEFDFVRPVYSGEVLTVTEELADVYDKTTSKGVLRFFEFRTSYHAADGELVCTVRTTNIERRSSQNG